MQWEGVAYLVSHQGQAYVFVLVWGGGGGGGGV